MGGIDSKKDIDKGMRTYIGGYLNVFTWFIIYV